MELEKYNQLFTSIKEVISQAKVAAFRSTNAILLKMYWEVGRLIVEDELKGSERAAYGKSILKQLSLQLSLEFGSGFTERNLNNMRAFFRAFPIWYAVRTELSWTHYRLLSRIEEESKRNWYATQAVEGNWDTRTLQRNINTLAFDRTVQPEQGSPSDPQALLKDPYIFEFLNLPYPTQVNERGIETALISHLQQFLMELGKGFAFVARQQHIVTDTADCMSSKQLRLWIS